MMQDSDYSVKMSEYDIFMDRVSVMTGWLSTEEWSPVLIQPPDDIHEMINKVISVAQKWIERDKKGDFAVHSALTDEQKSFFNSISILDDVPDMGIVRSTARGIVEIVGEEQMKQWNESMKIR